MESYTVVLYPDPSIGHLVSMVEFGKLIHKHHPSLNIIILIIPTHNQTDNYFDTISAITPTITFHRFPEDVVPPDFSKEHFDRAFGIPELYNPIMHDTLVTISAKSTIKGVILDFFTNAAFKVSTSLNIPTYYFFTGGASLLCVFLNFPTIHNTEEDDSNDYFEFPGLPAFHVSDMPPIIFVEKRIPTKRFLNSSINMANSSGIILNTFTEFEQRALDALRGGKCIPDRATPPVYLVGPLIAGGEDQVDSTENECLKWLDSQPSKSVVFLCFGSRGVFDKKQLKEIATGLERSEQRFLWVVRDPPPDGSDAGGEQVGVEEFLPDWFLARTRDKGLVVRNWAPQQVILSHGSVGGFLSYCGWNSIMESIVAGV